MNEQREQVNLWGYKLQNVDVMHISRTSNYNKSAQDGKNRGEREEEESSVSRTSIRMIVIQQKCESAY